MKKGWIIWLGAMVLISTAQAASFDCDKAQSKIEKLICMDTGLSALDDALSKVYRETLGLAQNRQKAIKEQQRWLKEIRNACHDADCLKKVYQDRIDELAQVTEKSVSKPKPKPRFTIPIGKGWSVCEGYTRFLNAQPESEPLPLCHPKLSPAFPDLKEPDWEEIDISSHLELTYALEKLTSPGRHDRPVDSFEHWKPVFEQQVKSGETIPRLRRVRLALIDGGPVETILAYEPDRNACDKLVKKNGYAFEGQHPSLFIWSEREQKVDVYKSHGAFWLPNKLLLFQDKPLLFQTAWGSSQDIPSTRTSVAGRILIYHFLPYDEAAQPYWNQERCQIRFDLTPEILKRMN